MIEEIGGGVEVLILLRNRDRGLMSGKTDIGTITNRTTTASLVSVSIKTATPHIITKTTRSSSMADLQSSLNTR